jgi:hypothetical protein
VAYVLNQFEALLVEQCRLVVRFRKKCDLAQWQRRVAGDKHAGVVIGRVVNRLSLENAQLAAAILSPRGSVFLIAQIRGHRTCVCG